MNHANVYAAARALDTNALWDRTHALLLKGAWGEARAHLDALGERGDVVDALLPLNTYIRVAGEAGTQLADHKAWQLRGAIDDRLAGINWRVGMRRANPSAGY